MTLMYTVVKKHKNIYLILKLNKIFLFSFGEPSKEAVYTKLIKLLKCKIVNMTVEKTMESEGLIPS